MAFGKEIKTSNSVTTEMRTRKEEICHLSENGMEIKDNPDLCDFFFFLSALGHIDVNYKDRG